MAERTPIYLDFAEGKVVELASSDTIPVSNIPTGYIHAVNNVIMNTTNINPSGTLGYGSWTSLGSGTIGATTVYYFERTD